MNRRVQLAAGLGLTGRHRQPVDLEEPYPTDETFVDLVDHDTFLWIWMKAIGQLMVDDLVAYRLATEDLGPQTQFGEDLRAIMLGQRCATFCKQFGVRHLVDANVLGVRGNKRRDVTSVVGANLLIHYLSGRSSAYARDSVVGLLRHGETPIL